MKLSPAHLVLLNEAAQYGKAVSTSANDRELIAELKEAGYLGDKNQITQLGRGALKGQGKGL